MLDEIDQYIHQLGSVSGNQKSSQGEMEYQIKYTEESPKSKQLSKTYGAPSPKKSKKSKSVTRNSNKLSSKKTGKSKVSNGDKLEPTVTQNSKTSIEVVRAREQSQVGRLQPRTNSRPKPVKSEAGAKRPSVSQNMMRTKTSKLWVKS